MALSLSTQSQLKGRNVQTSADPAFDQLEKKLLYPADINHRFDLWLDPIRSVPDEEKIFFTQNLAVMFKSGLSAARALRTLTLQSKNPKLKRVLFKVFRRVEKGDTIASALADYPKVFGPIFVNMVRAGESAGQLEDVLKELTHQLKRSHELKSKIKGALMYPTAILIAMTAIGTGMIIFVIPKLIAVFEEMSVELPLPTRILISVSNVVNGYLYLFAPGIALAVIALVYTTRHGVGKRVWHALMLRMPVAGPIVRKINLAKMSRTLSSLLETDMPIVDSFKLTANIVRNVHYQNSLNYIAASVEKGKQIGQLMAQYENLYPPVVQQMVQVGEETGEIASILNQLAEFYEEDVSQTMDSLPSLIEPILIVALGGAVGGMAVAVIMPMFSLASAV